MTEMAERASIWSPTTWFLGAALVAVPLIGPADVGGTELIGTVPAQWRVVWTESPQTRADIAWSTAEAGSMHRVFYDTEARAGELERYRWTKDAERNGPYLKGGPPLNYHHAALTELQPDTVYYFVMVSDDAVSPELHFRTAPDRDIPFAILHGGDSRSGRAARRRMNRRIAALTGENDEIIAFAHGGDYVYEGTSLGQWSRWMTDHELTVSASGRILPIIPTRGNHEGLQAHFDQVFGWPGGGFGANYFATALSPQVLLVTLNTETAAGGRQKEFLRDTLAAHRDVRWTLVQYHRPMWPAVKQPSAAKPHWQPLFDEFDVDLVCESDGHVLKRTPPIRGEVTDPDGVVYIGEGGLGVKQRSPDTDRWYLQPPGYAASGHHVWVLGFERDVLTMRAIGVAGGLMDESRRPAR